MTRIAFLISNRYQIHHYAPIARHLDDITFVIERRAQDFDVTADYIQTHLPGVSVDHVDYAALRDLDGEFRAIVCQTPVLPNRLLTRSLVVAQQYSLAKEAYQYGLWRSLCSLNLMYGPYSLHRVQGFCPAIAVGNPALDLSVDPTGRARRSGARPRVLYAPTYGSLSSLHSTVPRLADIDVDVTIKLHHADHATISTEFPAHWHVIGPDVSIAAAISDADVVVSDVSGVVFDALALDRPVVVVDRADADRSDLARLSSAEADGSRLHEFASRWRTGQDFSEAVERASESLANRREELLQTYFVNLAAAGAPAAAAIDALLSTPFDHPAPQIRADASELIEERFRFAQDNRRLRRANDRLRSRNGRAVHKMTDDIVRRGRDVLTRWPRTHRWLARVKHRLSRRVRR